MHLNLQKHKQDLLFSPLGGANEIGMNVNLYHLDGKWLMIDCGLGFAHEVPGVDMMAADISFIKAHKKDLLAIIITHIHEDHLGAVQYLWQDLEAPVYTSEFAAQFLRSKLGEYSFGSRVKINTINTETELKLGSFNIEFIGLTHSVPEMNALLIKTRHGNILHSGDWKFDPNPVVGNISQKERIKEYGDKGEILALVCDSTNALSPGHSRSEGDLFESLKTIIKDCKQLVGVTTFASNIARVFTIVKVAQACGRKVCLTGFSLQRLKEIAVKTGYFKDLPNFISDRELKFFKPSEVLILSTKNGENSWKDIRCNKCKSVYEAKLTTSNNTDNIHGGDLVVFRDIENHTCNVFGDGSEWKGVLLMVVDDFEDYKISKMTFIPKKNITLCTKRGSCGSCKGCLRCKRYPGLSVHPHFKDNKWKAQLKLESYSGTIDMQPVITTFSHLPKHLFEELTTSILEKTSNAAERGQLIKKYFEEINYKPSIWI